MGPNETWGRFAINWDDLVTYIPHHDDVDFVGDAYATQTTRSIPWFASIPIEYQPGALFSYSPYMDQVWCKQGQPLPDFHIPDGALDELLD